MLTTFPQHKIYQKCEKTLQNPESSRQTTKKSFDQNFKIQIDYLTEEKTNQT